MTPVLEGLRIVEGSAFVAAPLGGMTLAQLGADVIRFDAIGGGLDYQRWPVTNEGVSMFWAGLNKAKRSIQADLRTPEGRELVTAVITAPGPEAGIFLSNFPERGWLGYEALKKGRDDLIYVNIIGNPDESTAVDYTVNPSSGFAYATGPSGSAKPTNHVLPAWDTATGLTAALGLLAAERFRARTGEGQLVKLSLTDVAFAMVANLGYLAQAQLTKEERVSVGNDLYGAFGRDFPTADGRRVMVVAISLRQWQSLCDATQITDHLPAIEQALGVDLTKEGDRYKARDAVSAFIAPFIADHTLEELREIFDGHDVCWGPYQTFTQLVAEDPRCSTDNPMFAMVDQPSIGRVLVPRTPLAYSEVERGAPGPAPRLGEHTDEVLADVLGMTDHEIGLLHDKGVVAGPAV
ncbi:MAG: 2-methylfumaryl-CoA isomerase [Actinomycetia bacterium]|nr:2-methylfumaryl-CoA isomerase [Actinomycetes bacterium]